MVKRKMMWAMLSAALMTLLASCGSASAASKSASSTTAPLYNILIPVNALSAANLPFWTTIYSGAFKRHGLNVTTEILKGDTITAEGLSAGTYNVASVGAAAVLSSDAKVPGISILAPQTMHPLFGLWVDPSITSFSQLAGKVLAQPDAGGAVYSLSIYTLGLKGIKVGSAANDVHLFVTGGVPQELAAMKAGEVVGGILSPPTSITAAAAGYHELEDFTTTSIPFYQTALDVRTSWMDSHQGIVKEILAAYDEGYQLVRSNPAMAEAALSEYAHITDKSTLAATYKAVLSTLPKATPKVSPTDLQFMGQHLVTPPLPSSFDFQKVMGN